jgi:hypothetical protein
MISSNTCPLPVYIHISKNGGTSVRQLLQASLRPDSLLDTVVPQRWGLDNRPRSVHSQDSVVQGELTDVCDQQWRLACFASNLPFGLHEVIDRPCEYFTVVREPLSRVLSLWSDAYRARRTSRLWAAWEKLDLDLEKIQHSPCGTALFNDQTRMLTGLRQHEVGSEHVSDALANLEESFSVVGCFDDMPGFAERVCQHYGWKRMPIGHLNGGIGEGLDLLSDADLELLQAGNRFDLLLYEDVKAHWLRVEIT